jgi:LTXXQ motif family protein
MVIRLAVIVALAASLAGLAYAGPKPGGGPHGGGAPHGTGGPPGGGFHGMAHGGGGPPGGGFRGLPHGAPRIGSGPRMAAPHVGGGPRIGAPHAARIANLHGAAVHGRRGFARSLAPAHGPRARFAARPALRSHAITAGAGDRSAAARSANRALLNARPTGRASIGAQPGTLRSAEVRGQVDSRASAFARRAFSGAPARAQAARLFGDAASARHRFDSAFLARARFAGAFWPGPFFWPYAYYDDAFWLWPSTYDEAFWAYGYDDVLRGVYRPYAFADYDAFLEGIGRPVHRARAAAPPRSFSELCGQAAPGLTDWPVERIISAVEPNEQQRALLDALVKASDKAAGDLRAACPRNPPVTPVGRLDALEQQLAALHDAIRTVRPALEKFYNALGDDQKERFNALGPSARPARRARGVAAPQADRLARACQQPAAAAWPVQRIEEAVKPNERQRGALEQLRDATAQAERIVQAACPSDLPLTPTGRLAAMETRVDALRQAAATMRPALTRFYASLSDEQKARFNRALGSERGTG